VDGLFVGTHPNPAVAKSDGANMLPLNELQPLLERLQRIRKAIL
jgi:2-dehydro-3-deoxyphosphooctonate aldolase (KDO 8-P synthase)